jgi:hypothetical protein
MITNSGPFGTAYDANVLYREYCEEEVFVRSVIPILVHFSVKKGLCYDRLTRAIEKPELRRARGA